MKLKPILSLTCSLFTAFSAFSQTKTVQTYVKDGFITQSYNWHGININATMGLESRYGKYYIVYFSIENQTGQSFNFFPSDIHATFLKKNKEMQGTVLSNAEYMKIVGHRQFWKRWLYASSETEAANNAAINSSSSNTNINSSGTSYGGNNAVVSGNGNTYNINGSSQVSGNNNTNINSNTTTYNGAIGYAAQEHAQQKIDTFSTQQNEEKNSLNEGYLKANTIDNAQTISGQINIRYQKADTVNVSVLVNGETFNFSWDTIQFK